MKDTLLRDADGLGRGEPGLSHARSARTGRPWLRVVKIGLRRNRLRCGVLTTASRMPGPCHRSPSVERHPRSLVEPAAGMSSRQRRPVSSRCPAGSVAPTHDDALAPSRLYASICFGGHVDRSPTGCSSSGLPRLGHGRLGELPLRSPLRRPRRARLREVAARPAAPPAGLRARLDPPTWTGAARAAWETAPEAAREVRRTPPAKPAPVPARSKQRTDVDRLASARRPRVRKSTPTKPRPHRAAADALAAGMPPLDKHVDGRQPFGLPRLDGGAGVKGWCYPATEQECAAWTRR